MTGTVLAAVAAAIRLKGRTHGWVPLVAGLLLQAGCERQPPGEPITVDGSSTVYPLTDAVALDFMDRQRGTMVTVAFSGTVIGFQRLCGNQVDIADASRPITSEEQAACEANGVRFVELPVAHDALTVIVNAQNSWAADITVPELRQLWAPAAEKRITQWNQVRAGWPARPIALFGPGAESGTFDYFTDAVNGVAGASRKDYTASGNDEAIVLGVASDPQALGYVGFSYFERNRERLKALAVDDMNDRVGRGPIEPSPSNVGRGVYRPLARPLFIYVNAVRLDRPEVKAFVQHYLRTAADRAPSVGVTPLIATASELTQQRLAKMITGTMYERPDAAEAGIEFLLTQ